MKHTFYLRYRSPFFELSLHDGDDPAEAFHAAYERLYRYTLQEWDIELACLRALARVPSKRTSVQCVLKKKLPKRAIRVGSSSPQPRAQLKAKEQTSNRLAGFAGSGWSELGLGTCRS